MRLAHHSQYSPLLLKLLLLIEVLWCTPSLNDKVLSFSERRITPEWFFKWISGTHYLFILCHLIHLFWDVIIFINVSFLLSAAIYPILRGWNVTPPWLGLWDKLRLLLLLLLLIKEFFIISRFSLFNVLAIFIIFFIIVLILWPFFLTTVGRLSSEMQILNILHHSFCLVSFLHRLL